jgi:hypothetical protein
MHGLSVEVARTTKATKRTMKQRMKRRMVEQEEGV